MSQSPLNADALEAALSHARRHGADAAEAAVSTGESLSVDVRMGALEGVEREETASLSVRLFMGKRQAGAASSDLTPAGVAALVERVAEMARLAPEDPYCGLADPHLRARDIPDLDLHDPARPSAETLEEMARAAEAAALGVPGVTNSPGAGASWSAGGFLYGTSDGFRGESVGASYSLGVSALAERDGVKERDYDGRGVRKFKDLPAPEEMGRTAGERAVARLGARKIASRKAPVIIESRLAPRFIGAFLGAISGPAVARGVSFLKDRLGEEVFAPGVSIRTDPLRRGGLASRAFDGEGVAAAPRALIEDGRLTGWLLNSAAARQLGLTTTGDATYGGGGPPGVSASNVTVSTGPHDLAALMREAGEGLLVCEAFSASLNSNSGDYSVGVAGFWFENGARAYPVSEITIAGNLREAYRSMVPGADLDTRSSLETPSLLFDVFTIAGI